MSNRTPPPYDIGPMVGSYHQLIVPGERPFEANVVALIPRLDDAYFIRDACNTQSDLLDVLEVAREAIWKAVMTEDGLDDWMSGLDGGEGAEVLKRIDEQLQKHNRAPKVETPT